MRIPGRTLHPRLSAATAVPVRVELDPTADPLLGHVLASRARPKGGSRATFEAWFGGTGGRASVHIGIARVGWLDETISARVRPLIEDAERRGLKLLTTATLKATDPPGPPYVLSVNVPPG